MGKYYCKIIMVHCLLFSASLPAAQESILRFTSGTFYGPGPLGDKPFPFGELRNIQFTDFLTGIVPFKNNGAALPNVASEIELPNSVVDGLTSNGVLINENAVFGTTPLGANHITLGFYVVQGPNHFGQELIYLDEDGDFTLVSDALLDPGVPELTLPVDNFLLTTGPATIPESLAAPDNPFTYCCFNRAGSLPSGTVLIGRIGDFDYNGFLDGIAVTAINVPINIPIPELAGAPLASLMEFDTNIPIPPLFAAQLTANSIVKHFPSIMTHTLMGNLAEAENRVTDVLRRIEAMRNNVGSFLKNEADDKRTRMRAKKIMKNILFAHRQFELILSNLKENQWINIALAQSAFYALNGAVKNLENITNTSL